MQKRDIRYAEATLHEIKQPSYLRKVAVNTWYKASVMGVMLYTYNVSRLLFYYLGQGCTFGHVFMRILAST
jgi:hypothetical protein